MKVFSHGQWIEVPDDFGALRPRWYFRRLLHNAAANPPGLKMVPFAGRVITGRDEWIGLFALTPGEINHRSFRLKAEQ